MEWVLTSAVGERAVGVSSCFTSWLPLWLASGSPFGTRGEQTMVGFCGLVSVIFALQPFFPGATRHPKFRRHGCGCQNRFGIPFWGIGAPPVFEPILVGTGTSTGGTGFWLLTHGQIGTPFWGQARVQHPRVNLNASGLGETN